ncbi:hypothetical protein QR680_016733 [Steinernema hermaphroditum]|uniref:Uncharacterized protein n=1 Tax=Steinernema hermaphroditum TaxID=289476 RepID=A0AA39HC50_9BILA|nr:hypothetical protein QR680_016733 [Steinernema hermaphroditum]
MSNVFDPQRPEIKCDLSHYGFVDDFEICQNPTAAIGRGQWANSETNRSRFVSKVKKISKLPANTLTIRYLSFAKRNHEFSKSLLNALSPSVVHLNIYNVFCCDSELSLLAKRVMAKGTLQHLMVATSSLSRDFPKLLWKWLQKGEWRYVELSKVEGPTFDISFLEKLVDWWMQKGASVSRSFSVDLVISGREDLVLLNSFVYTGSFYYREHPTLRKSGASIYREGWTHFDVRLT